MQGVVQSVPCSLVLLTPLGCFLVFCGWYGILAGNNGGSSTNPIDDARGISRRTCLVTGIAMLPVGMLVLSSALAVYVGALALSDDVNTAVEHQVRISV